MTGIVYASARALIKRFILNVGLNWQYNHIQYKQANDKSKNIQNALNPNIQFMMPFGNRNHHAFSLSYKRTLADIPYAAISSAVTWSNAYNYTLGNANLKAPKSDMVMALLALKDRKVNLSLIYGHSRDRIYWQTFQDAENPNVFYTMPINLGGQHMIGMGAEWIEKPIKWWQFKLSGRIEITPENLTLNNVRYSKTRLKQNYAFSNNFQINPTTGATLSATVEPTFRTYDRTYHSVYSVDLSSYKTFLRNRLQLALDITALGNRRTIDRHIAGVLLSNKYTSPIRYVGLSITWRFSGGKQRNVDVVDGIQDYKEVEDNL